LSRADVHRKLIEMAQRKVGDLKRGGNWRRERALKINVDPDDDDAHVPVIKDPRDLHLIVAGGWGPLTAVLPTAGAAARVGSCMEMFFFFFFYYFFCTKI
jgi:hypothetical protein